MNEELEKLFGEELSKQVKEKLGDKKIMLNDGSFIPKDKFNTLNEEKKNLAEQLNSANQSLDKIKAENKGNEALQSQIDALKKENEQKANELVSISKRSAVESALRDAKAKSNYLGLLTKEIALNKVELDENGKLKDADSYVKTIKEKYSDVFGETQLVGDDKPGEGEGKITEGDYYSVDEIKKMSLPEVKANLDKVNKSMEYHNSK